MLYPIELRARGEYHPHDRSGFDGSLKQGADAGGVEPV